MNRDRFNFSMNGVGAGKHEGKPKRSLQERSEKARKRLVNQCDILNQLWAAAERQLKSMHGPHFVWVEYHSEPMDRGEPRAGKNCYCIGLIKCRGDWRICHGVYSDRLEDEPKAWMPITECSMEERVNAGPHIGKLREKIVESAEKYVVKMDKALQEMNATLYEF